MGYTHYWSIKGTPGFHSTENQDVFETSFKRIPFVDRIADQEPAKWIRKQNKFLKDMQKMFHYFTEVQKINLIGCLENNQLIDLKNKSINFNGRPGCENFYLDFNSMKGQDFCKTSRAPYDIVVCSTLLLFQHHFSKVIDIGSDGKAADWIAAAEINYKVVERGYKLPPAFLKNVPPDIMDRIKQMDTREKSEKADKIIQKMVNPKFKTDPLENPTHTVKQKAKSIL